MDHCLEVRVVVIVEMTRETDHERSRVSINRLGSTGKQHFAESPDAGDDESIRFVDLARADRRTEDVQQTSTSFVSRNWIEVIIGARDKSLSELSDALQEASLPTDRARSPTRVSPDNARQSSDSRVAR